MKTLDLADDAGITYRMLDFWIRKGYIKERSPGGGSGVLRDIADDEVIVVKKMASLVRIGIKPAQAAEYARLMVEETSDAVEVGGWIIAEAPEPERPAADQVHENITDVSPSASAAVPGWPYDIDD